MGRPRKAFHPSRYSAARGGPSLHRHRVLGAFLDEGGHCGAVQALILSLSLARRPFTLRHEAGLGGAGELFVRRLCHAGVIGVGERRRSGDAERERDQRERLGHGVISRIRPPICGHKIKHNGARWRWREAFGAPFQRWTTYQSSAKCCKSSNLKTLPEPEWSDAAPDVPAFDLARPGAARARRGGAACARSHSHSPARLHCWGRDPGFTARDREASARRSPTDRLLAYVG